MTRDRTKASGVITRALLEELQHGFILDWHGIHGVCHWGKVRSIGLRLAHHHGADVRVVELFSVLHDACRQNEGHDPDHGRRGASRARELNGLLFDLDERELELLCLACEGHSDGYLEADITVQVCWDADRLDLGRVGITPDPARLCTDLARQQPFRRWAYRRSIRG